MKKLLVISALAALSTTAFAQSSSTSAPAPAAGAATSSTSATEAKPEAAKSKWSGGVMVLMEKDAINKDTNFSSTDPNADIDGSNLMTQTHLSVGYKLNNGDSVKLIQRLFYDQSLKADRQKYASNWDFGTLRVHYTTSGKALGGDASLIIRTSLPTTQASQDLNMLMGVAAMPNLNWELNPKWSVSYSGYFGTQLYAGKMKEEPEAYKNYVATGYQGLDQNWLNGYMARSGAQRSYIYVVNTFGVGYNLTDTLSLSGSVGQDFGLLNYNFLKRVTQAWELGASVAWQATPAVGFGLGVSQQIADMPGAQDLNSGRAIYFDNYNVGLFRPEQTTYSLSTNVTF